MPGLHNARNACAALVAGMAMGASFTAAARALARYGGVARRFQFRGERDGVTFVDDYAHLPTEVAAALSAAADGGWRRIVAVFQPHRFTRTATLWRDFADAFAGADLLVVTDVYAAGEAPRPGVSGKLIVHAVLDAHPTQPVTYLPGRSELAPYLRKVLRPGDLCLTLGAGDLTSLPDELTEPRLVMTATDAVRRRGAGAGPGTSPGPTPPGGGPPPGSRSLKGGPKARRDQLGVSGAPAQGHGVAEKHRATGQIVEGGCQPPCCRWLCSCLAGPFEWVVESS